MRSIDQLRSARARRAYGRRAALLALAVALLAVALPARSQPIGRDVYIRHLPQTPAIIGQTRASAVLHLYGDASNPDYSDRAPIDGIDDRRGAHLRAIADRFSPILRRNNFLVPRDVWWVVGDRPLLKVDSWLDDRRVHADSIVIEARALTVEHSAALVPAERPHVEIAEWVGPPSPSWMPGANDARLDALVREFDPERLLRANASPGGRSMRVLFFDLPGDGEKTWRREYEKRGSTGSRIYAHFLIQEDTAATDDRRYMLVVQYLFFYPFNDGGNNHEGDWEHINVLIGTRGSLTDSTVDASSGGYITPAELAAVLDGSTPLSSLAICAVDYFFHHHMLRVEYRKALSPNHAEHPEPIPGSVSVISEDHDFIRAVIDARVHAFDGKLATHPIGYIGGNNKGPDELISLLPRFASSFNRNTGATYPFPGTWQTIGPLGATEGVWGAIVPTIGRAATPDSGTGLGAPDVEGDRWLTYGQADVELLPDWERLLPLIREDPAVRRQWAWLILPVRWGYPATRSPGAGAVPYTDLGNLAPLGPAFKPWWNRVGPDPEHLPFRARALWTPISPRVPWAVVQSGWGFLNYPLVLGHMYPFYNVAGAHIFPWTLPVVRKVGIQLPRTFVGAESGRIATIGAGAVQSFGGDGYARTLRRVSGDAALESGSMKLARERLSLRATAWPRVAFDMHIGRSLFLENSFAMGEAAVRYSGTNATAGDVALDGTLDMRQFTGGLRSSLSWPATPNSQAFARLGYGWMWYTLRDVRLDGRDVPGSFRGGYHPPLLPGRRSWPNMAYSGLTYEYFGPRTAWLFNRVGYGFRIDATFMLQRLPGHERRARQDLWMRRGDIALSGTIGW